MSFKDAPFSQRFAKLGDEAEGVFEAVWPKAWERWGINRPSVSLRSVPAFVRQAPDYWDSDGFIEVMGFGRDQTFKLKDEKHEALLDWAAHWMVRIFVWDSHKKQWSIAWLHEIEEALVNEGWDDVFSDGPTFVALKAAHWPGEWVGR